MDLSQQGATGWNWLRQSLPVWPRRRSYLREHICARTMRRVETERARFIAFAQSIIDRHGGRTDFAAAFPNLLRRRQLKPWTTDVRAFAERVDKAVQAGAMNPV